MSGTFFRRFLKVFDDLRVYQWFQEIELSDQKLRYEAELDDMKIRLLKFESDLNDEQKLRRVAENEAQAAKSVAQNLLRESHRHITKGLD